MVTGYDKFTATACDMSARHYRHNDYYDKDHQIPGIAFGKLVGELGVEIGQPIDDKTFKALALNRHPVKGEKLTREKEGRKLFCDMTVSAPKEFSVAMLDGELRGRVVGYHRQAVEKVKAEMERIVGRQAHNGKAHLERTGNLAGVAYEHTSNRCQESALHTHLVMFNVTKSPQNGKMYAVDFREFMDQSKYLTAVYRDELSRLAQADGLHIATGEKFGDPKIVELIEMAKDHQRRSDELAKLVERIEEHAGTKLDGREVGVLVRASRGLDVEKFERLWAANKAEFDVLKSLNPETAEADRREILERFREIVYESSPERKLRKVSLAEVQREQQERVTSEHRDALERVRGCLDVITLSSPRVDLDKSIDYAIEHCFQNESVIKDYVLYETIVQHAQGAGVNLAEMRSKVANHPSLILGLRNEIASSLHYRRELESMLVIEQGRGNGKVVSIDGLSENLSEHQEKTVKSLLGSRDQFTALSGSSGVGKSEYAIAPVIEQNVKAGCKVAVVAPSDDARNVLRCTAQKLAPDSLACPVLIRAESLQLFQANPRLHSQLGKNDLLIIDEASFVSLQQGHESLQWAAKRGIRVLLVGDLDQGKSIEAGDFFRLAIKSGVHTAELHDIKRQPPEALDGHYLEAVKLFKKGKTTEAFGELREAGCLRESKGQERVDAIADSISQAEAQGIAAMAVNISHRENDAIAAAVRKRLTDLGQLSDERTIKAYSTLGWSDAEKKDVSKLRNGMVLEITRGKDKGRAWTVVGTANGIVATRAVNGETRNFTAANFKTFDVCEEREMKVAIGDKLFARSANKKGQIINGERLTAMGWDDLGNPVDSEGRSIVHRNLSYGYASTVRKSQGSSTTKVIVGYDRHSIKAATKDLAYVAHGRGREFCEVHVESIADLSQIQNRSGERELATEMTAATKLPKELSELLRNIEVTKSKEESQAKIKGPFVSIKPHMVDLQRTYLRAEMERQQRQRGQGMAR